MRTGPGHLYSGQHIEAHAAKTGDIILVHFKSRSPLPLHRLRRPLALVPVPAERFDVLLGQVAGIFEPISQFAKLAEARAQRFLSGRVCVFAGQLAFTRVAACFARMAFNCSPILIVTPR